MRTTLTLTSAVLAIAVAAPALAQDRGAGIRSTIDNLAGFKNQFVHTQTGRDYVDCVDANGGYEGGGALACRAEEDAVYYYNGRLYGVQSTFVLGFIPRLRVPFQREARRFFEEREAQG